MAEHTPGPWEVGVNPADHVKTIYGNPGMDDSQLVPVEKLSEGVNMEANGHLIAASPDLLAALLDAQALLIETSDDSEWYRSAIEQANAAIKKARGKHD